MKKVLPLILICTLICTSGMFSGSKAVSASSAMRRPISNDNPLFFYNIYRDSGPENIEAFWSLLPDDLKDYFGIMILPIYPYNDSEENRNWIESMLDKAQELNVPVFIQSEAFNTHSNIPKSYYSDLFDSYSVLIGLCFAEISVSNLGVYTPDAATVQSMKDTIDLVASKGAYFLWQDMATFSTHIFLKISEDEALFNKFKENSEHIILMDKHNGKSKRYVTPAACMGFWLSDFIGHWGTNPEDWLWLEAGYSRLYEPPESVIWTDMVSTDDWKKTLTFPDAQYGVDWLHDMAFGATVYSLENPNHGFATAESDQFTPAFTQVLLPLIRKMINDSLIPSKEEVLAKVEVAFHPNEKKPGALENDEFFKKLYGSDNSEHEWMPRNGRYYGIPILPVRSSKEEFEPFTSILHSDNYDGHFPSVYEKVNVMNSLYEPIGTGDSWFINLDNHWLVTNPYVNEDRATSFSFPLKENSCTSMSGQIDEHTLAIISETEDEFNIHLSNYRIDANADVWDNPDYDYESGINDYIKNKYCVDPSDDELRQSIITIEGATDGEPVLVSITGDNGYQYSTTWDSDRKEYTIVVHHNGPVDMIINATGHALDSVPKNIAPYGHISTSSYENDNNMDEYAIDGLDHTRWNAAPWNKVGSWLVLQFDEEVTFNKVVMKEFLDRITTYDLQYWDDGHWITIDATKNVSHSVHEAIFEPVTSNQLRLNVTGTKMDSNNWGAEPSLYEFEVYSQNDTLPSHQTGENLAKDKTVTASSVYNNHESLVGNKVTDGDLMSRWNASGDGAGQWLEIDFGETMEFSKVVMREYMDRVDGYKLQYWDGQNWIDIVEGDYIGHYSVVIFDPVMSSKLRLYITSTKNDSYNWGNDPSIYEIQVYR